MIHTSVSNHPGSQVEKVGECDAIVSEQGSSIVCMAQNDGVSHYFHSETDNGVVTVVSQKQHGDE
jgi:hypothetical protein